MLVGLLGLPLFNPGSILQLVVATTFCIVYLVLQLQSKPFKDPVDDYLALSVSTSLVVLYFACVLIKLKALVELDEVFKVLSPSLRTIFDVPMILVSGIMLLSILASLAFSLVILVYQMRSEHRRQRLARRLRYDKDNSEVIPPVIATEHFHVFLSHTWKQGEQAMRTVKDRLREMMPNIKVRTISPTLARMLPCSLTLSPFSLLLPSSLRSS